MQAHQIMFSGSPQSVLLDRTNAGCRTTVSPVCTLPDFNEYQQAPVLHDKVNLAKAAPVISHDQLQTLLPQIDKRAILGLLAPIGGHDGRLRSVLYNALATGKAPPVYLLTIQTLPDELICLDALV